MNNSWQENELLYFAVLYYQERIAEYCLTEEGSLEEYALKNSNPNRKKGIYALLPLQVTERLAMINLLIQNGADINDTSYNSQIPLHTTIYSVSEEVIRH